MFFFCRSAVLCVVAIEDKADHSRVSFHAKKDFPAKEKKNMAHSRKVSPLEEQLCVGVFDSMFEKKLACMGRRCHFCPIVAAEEFTCEPKQGCFLRNAALILQHIQRLEGEARALGTHLAPSTFTDLKDEV